MAFASWGGGGQYDIDDKIVLCLSPGNDELGTHTILYGASKGQFVWILELAKWRQEGVAEWQYTKLMGWTTCMIVDFNSPLPGVCFNEKGGRDNRDMCQLPICSLQH